MPSLTFIPKGVTPLGMKTKSRQPSVAASPRYHLVTVGSKGKPLCGETSSDAAIGSYVEHLDTSTGEAVWVREVFGPNGKPVEPCHSCFAAYPSDLKQIIPFEIHVLVRFEPDLTLSGYNLSAKATAQFEDRKEDVKAYPKLSFTSAKWFYNLSFGLDLDANSLVPWVNKANREQRS